MTKKRNSSPMKKLIPAAGMLMVSAMMLATSTYAWFTMNKEVQVKGMQVKAQAEKGLLINEVATANDSNWDEEAVSNQLDTANYIALRPASTHDLSAWWHANSKKSNNEAGYGSGTVDADRTVALSGGAYYSPVGSGTAGIQTSGTAAAAGTNAARNIFYGSGTDLAADGGYYVMYTYYLKSSSTTELDANASNFVVDVTATKENTENSGSGNTLDLNKSLRVGVEINDGTNVFKKIYAPVAGADTDYHVTNNANGSAYTAVEGVAASGAIGTTGQIKIPEVTKNGIPVNVYIWFEGEDTHCKSDNLTAVLDDYQIDIKFTDNDLA